MPYEVLPLTQETNPPTVKKATTIPQPRRSFLETSLSELRSEKRACQAELRSPNCTTGDIQGELRRKTASTYGKMSSTELYNHVPAFERIFPPASLPPKKLVRNGFGSPRP